MTNAGRLMIGASLLYTLSACASGKAQAAGDSASPASAAATSAPPPSATATTVSAGPRGGSVQASKDGWWIKVRREKQESPTITFSIGSNNHTVEAWQTWNSSDPLEFDVPAKFRNINPLYIKAQSSGGRNTWFCMMYRGDGVKHFDFDDDEDHEEKQSSRDGECNFNN
jgi:hypothetical protein